MSTTFDRFSSRENLKKAYSYVLNELVYSSLSINPINHPATTAINDIGEQFFVALEKYLRSGEYKPEKGFFVYMPKDNLGLRPICVLSMVDRIVYQAIFNQNILGYKIDAQLSDKVCFANRINEEENSNKYLSQYFNSWDEFCVTQRKAFKKGYSWKLEVDVQQYYEHIPVERLIEKLSTDFDIKDKRILEILQKQLCTWAEYPELPKGIPQGPNASAVLGNVYLSSLDSYVEKNLTGKDLCYFRYADDITLMGKSKEIVLKATEKIVRFLREHNLTLNEKTKISLLNDTDTIEAMRFTSEYNEDTPEIPEDDLTRIQNNAPLVVSAILEGEKIDKQDIRELKYFLKVDTSYTELLMCQLIDLIPLRPSLTVPIVQYVSDGRKTLDDFDTSIIDYKLWQVYNNTSVSEWSRFWIFKLLVSNQDVWKDGIEIKEEVEKILSSKENTIFKIVCFYYQIIQGESLDAGEIKTAIEGSGTPVEKSIYSFFLLNAFQNSRLSYIKGCIENLLNQNSHELNLIGFYLFKNKPKVSIDDYAEGFTCHLMGKVTRRLNIKKETLSQKSQTYLIRSENLIPMSSASSILGVSRAKKIKGTVDLSFPEIVQFDKVLIKIQSGAQDIEIWYEKQHIITANYIDLGFSSTKKNHKPNRSWAFLSIISVLQNEDITKATADNLMPMLAKYTGKVISRPNVHQTKKLLTKAFRILFKTSDNPFIENKHYYQPKFTILPIPELRQKEIWRQGGSLDENINN